MSRNLFWLRDDQWARIEPQLPTDVRGVGRVDHRRAVSAGRDYALGGSGGAREHPYQCKAPTYYGFFIIRRGFRHSPSK